MAMRTECPQARPLLETCPGYADILQANGSDVDCAAFLHAAASNGHYQLVNFLLDEGVDCKTKTDEGRTALHGAAQNGHVEIVRLLLAGRADLESSE